MAMNRYKYSKVTLTFGVSICENLSGTRMKVCSGSIGRKKFKTERK
jgi:hypothetical protein